MGLTGRSVDAERSCVMLVSLDTLRADVAYAGGFPTFSDLGDTGTRFDRAISAAPVTPVSHSSVMTGRYPHRHGVRHLFRESLGTDVPTIAEALACAGYRCSAVVACAALDRWYGLDRGFHHYDDELPAPEFDDSGSGVKPAPAVVDRALDRLADEPDRPFFLFAHFFDAHWPYRAVDPATGWRNPYEAAVASMQPHLARLLAGASTQAAARGCGLLTVVFSDHGEDLSGWYADDHTVDGQHPYERGHGSLLFDTTIVVPLWLSWPRHWPRGQRIPWQVSLVDIAPTVAEAADVPLSGVDGRSLAPLLAGAEAAHRPAYSETFLPEELAARDPTLVEVRALQSFRHEGWTVVWEPGWRNVRCYDSSRDPHQRDPLPVDALPEAVRAGAERFAQLAAPTGSPLSR
jgi:arylsulfatase